MYDSVLIHLIPRGPKYQTFRTATATYPSEYSTTFNLEHHIDFGVEKLSSSIRLLYTRWRCGYCSVKTTRIPKGYELLIISFEVLMDNCGKNTHTWSWFVELFMDFLVSNWVSPTGKDANIIINWWCISYLYTYDIFIVTSNNSPNSMDRSI